jgi:hypothetical protein
MSVHLSKTSPSALVSVLCAALAAGLSGCDRPGSSSDTPGVNPAPTKFVRVSGTADSSLSIKVSTVYISSEKKCRRVTNWFAGASAPLSERVESPVSRSGAAYVARVSVDHFQEGRCRWRPYSIEFQATTRDGLTTGYFSTVGDVTRHVDGPVSAIWFPDSGRGENGAASIAPLVRECRKMQKGDVAGLLCIPPARGNVTMLAEHATQVQVNFRDLTASP